MTALDISEQVARDIATRLFAQGCLILGDPHNVRDAFERAAREHFGFVAQAGSMDRFITDVRQAMMDYGLSAEPDMSKDHWRALLIAAAEADTLRFELQQIKRRSA